MPPFGQVRNATALNELDTPCRKGGQPAFQRAHCVQMTNSGGPNTEAFKAKGEKDQPRKHGPRKVISIAKSAEVLPKADTAFSRNTRILTVLSVRCGEDTSTAEETSRWPDPGALTRFFSNR